MDHQNQTNEDRTAAQQSYEQQPVPEQQQVVGHEPPRSTERRSQLDQEKVAQLRQVRNERGEVGAQQFAGRANREELAEAERQRDQARSKRMNEWREENAVEMEREEQQRQAQDQSRQEELRQEQQREQRAHEAQTREAQERQQREEQAREAQQREQQAHEAQTREAQTQQVEHEEQEREEQHQEVERESVEREAEPEREMSAHERAFAREEERRRSRSMAGRGR